MAEAHTPNHPYHLVQPSPWPIVGAISAFALALGGITFMHGGSVLLIAPGILGILYTMLVWWRDVIKESNEGFHTAVVQLGLRYGMILFIASEVMFFVAWFWAFFDASLNAGNPIQVLRSTFTGGHWPPTGIEVFDPWHFPLTIVLGLTFTCVQAYEYSHAAFSFGGNIYGATFFMATGFHGFHVIIGSIFLIVCFLRAVRGDFTPQQHFGFEAAAWYWHFVDVVWLFLFSAIYVWGGWGGVIAKV
jgi:cytochrome c oxidase subunit 3